jgi:hypothetical protein
MNSYPTLAAALQTILLITANEAWGQGLERPTDADRAAHLARMKALAASVEVFAEPRRPDSKAELVPEAVLRYSDNTRQNDEASLWIWGTAGRPRAIMAIEFYPNQRLGPRWLYEIASLSTERITAERGADLKWTAKEPGLKLEPIADAQPPVAQPIRRLAQMKALRARFTAHEHTTSEGRIELRPLTSPLHRYEDPANGIVDGAIFSFANGTNPEVLLALEARESVGKTRWVYAFVQMTGAAVKAQLDGKEVWERREADPPAVRDSYVNGWLPSESPAK